MNVVIVESPAKAKTINKYLGADYKVLASYGHVRDLLAKDGAVDPENGFAMQWQVDDRSKKQIAEIRSALKGADQLLLATDPDREGEAISWHVLEVLAENNGLKNVGVKRVVFHEITKRAVTEAVANPRDINVELVNAYLA
ncbi:MAG: toprim domain-containing protein, partial [Alphaproteobacteria bacterium]|nr:toprim domain-containing protein [Alphaproteobacteria bacterium]